MNSIDQNGDDIENGSANASNAIAASVVNGDGKIEEGGGARESGKLGEGGEEADAMSREMALFLEEKKKEFLDMKKREAEKGGGGGV